MWNWYKITYGLRKGELIEMRMLDVNPAIVR
jgi:hypothetical protein